jgi:hypothetical protein
MQTDKLHTEALDQGAAAPKPHSLIGSDRVEGTPVRRSDGSKIGAIERVMIDKLSGNVAYAVLSFGGFLGMGQKHLPIPWARLRYDQTLGAYQLDLRLQGDIEASPGKKPQQFLRGHGFWDQTVGVPFGGNFINEVSIIAWTDTAGVVHGSATWVGGTDHIVPGKGGRTITGYPWHLVVTDFVRVNANTVFVEGIVTQSGQNPSDVGTVVQWIVRDNGSGASGERDMVNDVPIQGGNFNVGP